ncbi:hypothetical protein B0H14DRAFT_2658668, partial [Mycena olivaceomarginata]
ADNFSSVKFKKLSTVTYLRKGGREKNCLKGKEKVGLAIKELELEVSSTTNDNLGGGNTNGDGAEAEKSGSRKRKMTAEEEEIAETIEQLQKKHRCSDKACSFRYCFLGTPFLFKIWASAIVYTDLSVHHGVELLMSCPNDGLLRRPVWTLIRLPKKEKNSGPQKN